ncbi:ABC transporter ATP-binding protein [Porcipelethomonas sp.]|uniref:ABC transporter ATP-binding protein n=1 Tax=Porcipelethomonas sp. TaxID=2981675 RepID=UPI003EF51B6A
MFKTIKRILQYAKPYKIHLFTAVFCSFIGVVLSLFVPVLIGKGVDIIIGKNNVDFHKLIKICAVIGVVVIISAFFQWITSLSTNKLSYHTIKDIRTDLFNKLNAVPLKFIDNSSKGDLIGRAVNDIETISDGLLQGFTQLFSGVVTILGTLGFMLSINVKIALLVVILTPISLFTAAIITKLSHDSFTEQSALRGKMSGFTEEMVGNQKIVKSFSYEKRAEKTFSEINEDMRKSGIKAVFFSSMTNPTTRFVNGLIYAAVGTAGALSAIGSVKFLGVITVGQLSSFLSYSNQYTKPFNEISGVITELQNAIASAERVFAVIDEPAESSDSGKEVLASCDGTLTMENVNFSYIPEKKLIQNFNLNVKPGQKIAIVGPTGCGKTTVINLLLRFYDINSGIIRISGKNTMDLTRSSLRSQFGMVLQDTWLFNGTVAENIAYGKHNASMEEIIAAAKAVHAHSFIKRLPEGYNTIIDEEGSGLSQGQKQLISIARIMITDPPMLILDEATSSIDIRTEQRIQRAFEKIMTGKTSFIIAHRLSTIKNADVILVMKDGNIIEQGNHEQLLEKKGFYAELYSSQFAPV